MHRPSWFSSDSVLIINAKTCGINKDGKEQYLVNPKTGIRSGSKIDDSLAECCDSIVQGDFNREEIFYQNYDEMIEKDAYVPKYFDHETLEAGQSKLSDTLKLEMFDEMRWF